MKERNLISKIKSQFTERPDHLLKGIGDDCAVFKENGDLCWLASTDLLVENTHFILAWHRPFLLGRKSIAVNLSDIAAMGGQPQFILVSLSIPEHISDDWLTQWYQGVKDILAEHNCTLIGGDTTQGEILTINVTILGTSSPDTVVYRSGAYADQDIYVTGPLGASAAGFELLKRGQGETGDYPELINAHLNPHPQVDIGYALGRSGLVSAMQDISDGLSTDISHICRESNVGATIEESKLPHSAELHKMCRYYNLDITNLMLNGGEDYKLVFTADAKYRRKVEEIAKQLDLLFYRVGRTNSTAGVFLQNRNNECVDIRFKGFEHEF